MIFKKFKSVGFELIISWSHVQLFICSCQQMDLDLNIIAWNTIFFASIFTRIKSIKSSIVIFVTNQVNTLNHKISTRLQRAIPFEFLILCVVWSMLDKNDSFLTFIFCLIGSCVLRVDDIFPELIFFSIPPQVDHWIGRMIFCVHFVWMIVWEKQLFIITLCRWLPGKCHILWPPCVDERWNQVK